MLRIEMLPAGNGDALWIEYDDGAQTRRLLIDGGTEGTWTEGLRGRIESLPADQRTFELLIVTHIDGDHIEGALGLLNDDTLGVTFEDVWFNGWRHLPDTLLESLGPIEGELLTDTIVRRALPWNKAFGGGAIVVPAGKELPRKELAGGLSLTVLTPRPERLAELKPVWREEVVAAGLDPDRPREPQVPVPSDLEPLGVTAKPDLAALNAVSFREDSAEANGSSIVVLLEHGGRRALLTGDGFPTDVLEALPRLTGSTDERLAVDAFKVPHHGSRFNVSAALLRALDCKLHLFSSNGSRTKHPHPEAIARVLTAGDDEGQKLVFNYRTKHNEMWDDDELRDEFEYETVFPADSEAVSVTL
jgi:hypothetical protein